MRAPANAYQLTSALFWCKSVTKCSCVIKVRLIVHGLVVPRLARQITCLAVHVSEIVAEIESMCLGSAKILEACTCAQITTCPMHGKCPAPEASLRLTEKTLRNLTESIVHGTITVSSGPAIVPQRVQQQLLGAPSLHLHPCEHGAFLPMSQIWSAEHPGIQTTFERTRRRLRPACPLSRPGIVHLPFVH